MHYKHKKRELSENMHLDDQTLHSHSEIAQLSQCVILMKLTSRKAPC
uniref:Uncharacterized protein n=1 Tax=Anguilla anguilla TaxID=7936 RepID=A0A0E9PDC9_ANGAN